MAKPNATVNPSENGPEISAGRTLGRSDRPRVRRAVDAARWAPAGSGSDYGFAPPAEDPADLLDWLRAELDETIDTTGLTVQLVQRCGDAARQLAQLAADTRADAIVLGAPVRWVHRIAGSVPVWLTRHACCPVVIVP